MKQYSPFTRSVAGRKFAKRSFSSKRIDPARLLELKTMPYEEYLQTPEWKKKRFRALSWARGKCEQCHSRNGLEVHHLTYERRGEERVSDLQVLCRDCHETEHLRQMIEEHLRDQVVVVAKDEASFYGS